MITSGSGGYVTVTAGKDDALAAPYALTAWAAATEYKQDDQVSTTSTDGSSETKYWVAKDDHTADAGDETGETATKAGTLAATHWEEIDAGELVELVEWSETRTVESGGRNTTLLRENAPRTTQVPGPVNLSLTYADNYESSPLQRALGVVNQRVYVRLYPKGEGSGLEIRHGYMRVGEFTSSGNQTDELQNQANLSSDGEWTVEAQS